MATSITDNVSAQFLQDLLNDIYQIFTGVGNEWVEEGIVFTTFGVPGSRGLPNIKSTNNPLGVNSPTPRVGDFSATFDLSQRVVVSIDRMARIEIDPNDYTSTFETIRSKGLLNALSLDPELRAAIFENFEEAVSSSISNTMSIGDGSDLTNGSVDWLKGFFPLITEDVGTIRAEFIPAANPVITTANILPIMEFMIQTLPARLDKKKRDTKFNMSLTTWKVLQQANRENGVTSTTYLEVDDKAFFAGYEIKTVSDLPDGYIQLTPQGNNPKSNLVMSGWASADTKNFNVYKESEGDTLLQGVLRFQAGVQLRAAEDVVWYADQTLVL